MLHLYHGSGYRHRILVPGFERSGVERRWDEHESNRFLYATTDRDTAVILGIAAVIEKTYPLNEFTVDERSITFRLEDSRVVDIRKLQVFLYEINGSPRDWVKNNNPHNRIDTEYKTAKRITPASVVTVNVPEWLHGNGYLLKQS